MANDPNPRIPHPGIEKSIFLGQQLVGLTMAIKEARVEFENTIGREAASRSSYADYFQSETYTILSEERDFIRKELMQLFQSPFHPGTLSANTEKE